MRVLLRALSSGRSWAATPLGPTVLPTCSLPVTGTKAFTPNLSSCVLVSSFGRQSRFQHAEAALQADANPDNATDEPAPPKPVTHIPRPPKARAVYLATLLKNNALPKDWQASTKIPDNWVRLTFAERDALPKRYVPKAMLRKAARFREAIGIARRAVRRITARFTPDYFEETGHPDSLLATMLTCKNVDAYSRRVLNLKKPKDALAEKLAKAKEKQQERQELNPKAVDASRSAKGSEPPPAKRPPLFLRPMTGEDLVKVRDADLADPNFKADRLPILAHIEPEEADLVLRQLPVAEVEAAVASGSLDISEEELLRRKLRKAEMVGRIISLYLAGDKYIDSINRKKIMLMFGNFPGDTASPEVRLALMSYKIVQLRKFMANEKNRKDTRTKVELYKLVLRRQRYFKVYKGRSQTKYYDLLHRIGLREVRYLGYMSRPIHWKRTM